MGRFDIARYTGFQHYLGYGLVGHSSCCVGLLCQDFYIGDTWDVLSSMKRVCEFGYRLFCLRG